MPLTNPWVGYAQRTYQGIKDAVLTVLPTLCPEITDFSESNPFIKILSIWAGIAEMLSYYIDNAARESHLYSCRLYRSGVQHAYVNDYRVHLQITATGDVLFTVSAPAPSAILIPKGTQINNPATDIEYYTVEDCTIAIGETMISVGIRQGAFYAPFGLGVSTGAPNQIIYLTDPALVATADLPVVYVNGIAWTHEDTFGFSGPADEVYMVTVDPTGQMILIFGDGVTGKIPPTAQSITISGVNTVAELGNAPAGSITDIQSAITLPGGLSIVCTNTDPVSGGAPLETLVQLKARIPKSLRTLYRAVTKQDYIDVTELFAGVGRANTDFNCGKKVTLYIVPTGGGFASTILCAATEVWLDDKKMITTGITVLPAGLVYMIYDIDVRTKPNYVMTDVSAEVKVNLVDFHSYNNQKIKGSVQLGDIYQQVENTDGVLWSKVNKMTAVPYAMKTFGSTALVWTVAIQAASNSTDYWDIIYTGSGFYQLLQNNGYIGTFAVGVLVTLPEVAFTVASYPYVTGDSWRFWTYPYYGTLVLAEQSMATTDNSHITLNMSGGI